MFSASSFNWMGENSRNYRLSPSEFNNLTYQLAAKSGAEVASQAADDFHVLEKKGESGLIICPVSRDAESKDKVFGNLPFVADQIESIRRKLTSDNYRLCLFIVLSRGYFKIPTYVPYAQRHHIVFSLFDLKTNQFTVIDSQGWIKRLGYPDKFAELTQRGYCYNPEKDYYAYGNQSDDYMCGIYAYKYLTHFLKTRSIEGLENIKIDLNDFKKKYANKMQFLKAEGVNIGNDTDTKDIIDEFEVLSNAHTPEGTFRRMIDRAFSFEDFSTCPSLDSLPKGNYFFLNTTMGMPFIPNNEILKIENKTTDVVDAEKNASVVSEKNQESSILNQHGLFACSQSTAVEIKPTKPKLERRCSIEVSSI